MPYEVRLSRRAAKQIVRLPERHRARMVERLRALSEWPTSWLDVIPLKGNLKGCYRLRSGDYRALLTVLDELQVIVVEQVEPRESVYD